MALLSFCASWPRGWKAASCLGLAAIVGAGDYVSPDARSLFTLLYLLPVSLSSFFLGRPAGVLLAAICAVLSIFGGPVALTADRVGELGIFLATALLAARLREGHTAERAALEDARRARRDALRSETAIEQARESILITDVGGAIRYVNPAFTQVSGYTSDEVVGRNVRLLKSGVHDDAFYRDLWTTILAGRVWHGEMTNKRKDATLFVERTTIVPVRNESGDISHFVALKEDVSERKRAEEKEHHFHAALENAAAEWLRTFDAMQDAVVIVDAAGRILRLNRAARDRGGGSYADWLGRNVSELGANEPWRSAAALVAEASERDMAAPRQVRDEVDGRWWHLTATRMPGGNDRFILVARDVTQMVELQESVRQAETMAAMGALVAGVAHEVRNPLFGISVNVDALAGEIGGKGDLGEVIDALRREVGRLGVFMENLLEYGKPAKITLSEGPLESVIDAAIQSCGTLASSFGVVVKSGVEPGRWRIRMNRSRLAQVFENLFKNAIQHSPRGAVVTVDADGVRLHGADWVRCRVADEGPGFRPEDVPRLFEPFFSRRRGGTGLGLAIVQRIVQEHGGRIHADNRTAGGAVMMVELPCAGG